MEVFPTTSKSVKPFERSEAIERLERFEPPSLLLSAGTVGTTGTVFFSGRTELCGLGDQVVAVKLLIPGRGLQKRSLDVPCQSALGPI